MAREQINKDKAMASYLKEHGVMRRITRCPLTYSIVPVPYSGPFIAGLVGTMAYRRRRRAAA